MSRKINPAFYSIERVIKMTIELVEQTKDYRTETCLDDWQEISPIIKRLWAENIEKLRNSNQNGE